MGREWLHRVGGSGGVARPSTRRGRMSAQMREENTSAGCMCSVFQLFDLNRFQLPSSQQHSLSNNPFFQEEVTTLKGVEAPRNSLELEEPAAAMEIGSNPLAMKEEENLNFPVGMQIKTKPSNSASKSRTEDSHPESSTTSPATKTPNLVARLMGLDLLPEYNSPSLSCPNCEQPQTNRHLNRRNDRDFLQTRSNRCFSDDDISFDARSLPETPRISWSRRSDVDHHRLSLQINKENTNEEFAKMVGRKGRFRQHLRDENRSPRHYAKQIVRQVKESVSRRVGLDITNTHTDREEIRRDQNLLHPKQTKRNSKLSPRLDGETSPDGKESTASSCSPKLRCLESKKSKAATDISIKSPRNSTSSDSYHQSNSNSSKSKHQENQQQKDHGKKAETGNSSRMKKLTPQNSDQAIRNKKEEPFVRSTAANKANSIDKKSKKAPLSSELLHKNGPTLLPVKKVPSPPATKLPQKQLQESSDALSSKRNTRLSSNTRHSYKQLHLHPDKLFTVPENVLPDNTNGCATTTSASASTSAAPEYKCYIQKILNRVGIIDRFTPLTLGKWHASSHPLDLSIFHYLELFHPTSADAVLSRRCNRILIFQLVDELLAEILRPHLDFKPWISPTVGNIDRLDLVDELCKKVESFPAADCKVLEDIDSLIDKDMCNSPLNGYFEEEGESVVCEIEGEIVEWLVSETAAMIGGVHTDDGRSQNGWMSRENFT